MKQLLEWLSGAVAGSSVRVRLRSWADNRALRLASLAIAALIFGVGTYWSIHALDISLDDLRLRPLTALASLVAVSLLYGGVGLALLARSAGLSVPLGKATVTSAYAYLAEMLPIPGGAVVRVGALMRAGGTMRMSSLVVLTAVLWIALAMIGAGAVLLWRVERIGWAILVIGALASVCVVGWLWAVAGIEIAMQTLVHRCIGILLTGLRLQAAFAALGAPIEFSETFPFVLAVLLGSASMIAPAGLGISEAVAALVAMTGDFAPSTAFLATGLDRLFCVAACGVVVLISQFPGARAMCSIRSPDI
jgi:hypothetical protein